MSEFQQKLFPGCIYTNGNGSELEEINQVLHMLVLGQHSFSICFLFFLQCSLISALPFVVTSSYRFQSAGKRCFNTHSQSPFCVILMTIYAKKAHHDEGEPQPTNFEFGPWGSRSDWTIVNYSESKWVHGSSQARYQEETHCAWACYVPSKPGENEHFVSCGSQITPSTSLTFSP